MSRVVLAMSGGVDSSVAAHLLLDAGHEVIGVFMRHGEASAEACKIEPAAGSGGFKLPVVTAHDAGGRADHKQGCCSATDAADARRVAAKLNIPFYSLDLQSDFRRIVDYFVADYLNGRTPNPCVKCNHWIKFGRLFDFAAGVEAEFVATGHYARIERDEFGSWLARGLDGNKDQSYALFGIAKERLARMLLPVGDYDKPLIRKLAAQIGLNVAEKKDSQEICFVTQGHHSDFVKAKRGPLAASTAGRIMTVDGKHVGDHDGYEAYTIGQRKGLGIAMGEPHFVVRIEPQTCEVVIGPRPAMMRSGLVADGANWFIDPPSQSFRCQVQIRYNADAADATVTVDHANQFTVAFDVPEAGVAPGQAAVVYQGTRVLGGGWIERSLV